MAGSQCGGLCLNYTGHHRIPDTTGHTAEFQEQAWPVKNVKMESNRLCTSKLAFNIPPAKNVRYRQGYIITFISHISAHPLPLPEKQLHDPGCHLWLTDGHHMTCSSHYQVCQSSSLAEVPGKSSSTIRCRKYERLTAS